MSSTAQQLKVVLRQLPYEDRTALAHFQFESLDDDAPPGSLDESLDETLARRLREILDGTVVGEPAFDAIARVRRNHE